MEIIQPLQSVQSSRTRESLATAFNRICGNGIPFLAPQEYDEILSEIPVIAQRLNGHAKADVIWNLSLIENMLEKGYNPAALSPTLVSTNLCIDSLKPFSDTQQQISVVELGTGAGWSTLILYNFLRNYFDDFILHAIDESPFAIGCTAKMLERFGILYQISEHDENATTVSSNQSGKVVLHVNDFFSATNQFKTESIHAVYSNHGTTYLELPEHSHLLKRIQSILIPNGVFISDSLDPQISMNLSKPFVMSSILIGKNKERFSKLPAEQYFLYDYGDNGIKTLKVMRDESAANFLDWLNHLLYSGQISVFIKYISALRRSVKSQQIIREWVKVPSKHLHNQANEGKLPGWQSVDMAAYSQVPYIQTVKLIKV